MMGERDPQKQLWSYQVNLDKRVRSDHPLRRIYETLELDFVQREVAKFYGTKGSVSEDPVVIMKMMLLLFLDNAQRKRVDADYPGTTRLHVRNPEIMRIGRSCAPCGP
jgi:transposase